MTIRKLSGRLVIHADGEADDVLWCGHERVADWAEALSGRLVTIRYWVSNDPHPDEEMKRLAVLSVLGLVSADYGHHYSEMTGYLWTDEEFNVGGHDMIERLKSDNDKYLLLEAEFKD